MRSDGGGKTSKASQIVGEVYEAASVIAIPFSKFVPIINDIVGVTEDITQIYQSAEHNKRISLVLVERIAAVETSLRYLKIHKDDQKNFFNQENFVVMQKLLDNIQKIKKFIGEVTQLKGLSKYIQAKTIQSTFFDLTNEFDGYINTLKFAIAVDTQAHAERTERETQIIHKDIDELNQIRSLILDSKTNQDQIQQAIEIQNQPLKLADLRKAALSSYVHEEFDDSLKDQELVKAWRLNHGLHLDDNNFMPSNRIILGYNGKLDIIAYSGEPLVYAVVNDGSDKPRSFWDILRHAYPEFSSVKENTTNNIFETDVCLLFPIAIITYAGPISNNFKLDLDNEEVFIIDNYGHFYAKKLLAGGKLILRNFGDAKSVQVEHLKSHLIWALNSYKSQKENPFESTKIIDFPIIETTNGNFLKIPKDLAKWIKRLYEDNFVEIISYEEIVPVLALLKKVIHNNNSESAFTNRLIPGISNKHLEFTLNEWIGKIPSKSLPTWINKFQFQHGILVDQFGIFLAKKQAFTFTQSPNVTENNNYYLQLIQPETRMEDVLLRNNITHKSNSIPFLAYNENNSAKQIDDVIYLFLHNEKIEISFDQCITPLPVFEKAVDNAIRSIHPYRELQKVFNEFGHIFPKSVVLGSQLREILKKQINTSNHASFQKICEASSLEEMNKILEYVKGLDLKYLLTPGGQVIKLNHVIDWFSEFSSAEKLKPIRIDKVAPLYKILNCKLQNEVEIILENRLDSRVLLTGIKTFDFDNHSTEAYARINFDEHKLDSRSYDVFGIIFDNKDIKSEECIVRFSLLDCYGFSAFVNVRDSVANNIKGWQIFWMIVGRPSVVGAFGANYRETNIAFHKVHVDSTKCYDNVIYLPLPLKLIKNCIVLFSASYAPSNDPPKQNFKLLKWSKDVLKIKIITFDIDQPRPSQFYLNICIIYPCEKMAFKVDVGEKLVTYDLFGQNLDVDDYDQFIDFNCYKDIYFNCLNVEFPVKNTKYLYSCHFGYWTIASSGNDNSQLVIKHIIKRRLPSLVQYRDADIPFEAYFMKEVYHVNLVKYINIIETENTFLLITELGFSNQTTNWEALHHYLNHNGALSENQAKKIFQQVVECISFIYKHGFFNININDKNIMISESQIKLFNLEHLMSDEFNENLVYDIQYEDDYNASPEMITGHNYNPEFSDLWSLGVLLYTMIHAYVPFKKPVDTIASTLEMQKSISKECSTILHRLLAKKPHLRGSFKNLLNNPWLSTNIFSRKKGSNNLKKNVGKDTAIEKVFNSKIMRKLDEIIEESQNDIESSLPLQWITVNSLSDIKLIGKGGFGLIFSATWKTPQISGKPHFYWQRASSKVVLKECLNAHENDENDVLKNFLREMRIHAKINGLWGIIDFYGIACGHKPNDLKMVLHHADKYDLNEYLSRNFTSIMWKEKLSIILDIAVGLYQIHDKGIVHRDFHPGNIFLDSSISCIGDFGLSQVADSLTNNNGELFGILPYMAPEVLKEGRYSYASDIYAFGVILIKIATGRNIYDGKSRKEILSTKKCDDKTFDDSIPSFFKDMIQLCCDEEPLNRPKARTLVNEIIDWKLNKMHQFNDKKVLVSYMAEMMVEKSQNNIENDETMFFENDENNDVYSKMKNGSVELGEYIKKAADGDLEAMKNVAICLLKENGIENNMNEAFSWFMKCFNKKIAFTREELIPLFEYFSQDSSDLERQIRYGMMLECGLGVDRDLTKAYLIYKKAANSGHALAQFKTGRFCEQGWGREQDLKEAFHWFKKAIEQKNLGAWSHLNKRYMASFRAEDDLRNTVRYISKITRLIIGENIRCIN
ncbi:14925_t:CDS:2 [Gigaspora margarita]|uniref:14925_t:CDS:1 n=1 Tax=Gigaspora margarita TaxID=4874 RepID=A0ABM8VXA4_GIGMA|nr:14925_t:CDS:2 [Gigaspora margarita]